MSVDIAITYLVTTYVGKPYEFNTRKEADAKYKIERKSDPTVSIIRRTEVTSIKHDHLK